MRLPAGKVMPASGGIYSPPFKKAAGGLHHISGVSILRESYRKWKNTLIKAQQEPLHISMIESSN